MSLRRVLVAVSLFGFVAAPASGGDFSPSPAALAGRDSAVTITEGCDDDAHMDAEEEIVYGVRFQSAVVATNVQVTLTAVDGDCDSPPSCPPGSTLCADPERLNNSPFAGLAIQGSPFTLASLPANIPVTAEFFVSVSAGLLSVSRIEMLVTVTADSPVVPSKFAFRHAVNADEVSRNYSTDFPGGGTQIRDFDDNEVDENPNGSGDFETIQWSSYTQGTAPDGTPIGVNFHLQGPWNFDSSNEGFTSGLSSVTNPFDFPALQGPALWGEDWNFNALLDVWRCSLDRTVACPDSGSPGNCGHCAAAPSMVCNTGAPFLCPGFSCIPDPALGQCTAEEDRDRPNGVLDQAWSTLGGCGWQTPQGAWHTGLVGSPSTTPPCTFSGNGNGPCQTFETLTGTTGKKWYELLLTPVVQKVNQAVDTVSCDPLARVEILDFAWNQEIDLPDAFATFTWEVDNDCAGPAVSLFADTLVLGSVTGPYGAMSGGAIPTGMGYPLFAPLASCDTSGDPCVTDQDCPTSQSCVWATIDVNGNAGQDRLGGNACFFKDGLVPPSSQGDVRLARPRDDDVNNDSDLDTDEHVTPAGPLRNMDITRAGGPDLKNEMLEDRIGEAGTCLLAAFGMMVRESSPTPAAGFGVTIDDVVLEWREVTVVPDATACTPGEAKILATSKDPGTGDVTITYKPACASTDHAVYWGSCSPLLYSGQDCSVGTSGTAVVNPGGTGCFGFVVVGNDGAGVEGSYGLDSNLDQRPPYPTGCLFSQLLATSCD